VPHAIPEGRYSRRCPIGICSRNIPDRPEQRGDLQRLRTTLPLTGLRRI
jgi:hypothetical protein